MKLPSVPDIGCRHVNLFLTPQDHLCTHESLWSLYGGLVAKWCITNSFYLVRPSLLTSIHSSCNLAQTGYHLFHSLDNHLRGRSFANKGDLRNALTDFFTSKTADFYHQDIVKPEERWQKVLDADGAYFET